jgi:hypothetical protein
MPRSRLHVNYFPFYPNVISWFISKIRLHHAAGSIPAAVKRRALNSSSELKSSQYFNFAAASKNLLLSFCNFVLCVGEEASGFAFGLTYLLRPFHSSGRWSPAFHRDGPCSIPGQIMWDLWWSVTLGQVFSEYFGFPCQFFHSTDCFTLIII